MQHRDALCQSEPDKWNAVLNKVTVVGSINIDLTSYLDRWPEPGETVSAKETLISLGGKGANQAVAAARLGAQTAMIGAVGPDAFGRDVEERLQEHNIDLYLSRPSDGLTGMAFIDVGPDGNNVIRISPGANATLSENFVAEQSEQISDSKVVLLQNEVPVQASLKAAELARASGALVVMDPAPAPVPFWTAEQLSAFDILTPNAHEAQLITGNEPHSLDEALEAAQALTAHGVAGSIITMGSMGVAWSISGMQGKMEAPKVRSIDTVAAGDCFNGAFAAALACGHETEEAIRRAVHAAALATTRKGAASSIPTLAELEHFLSNN